MADNQHAQLPPLRQQCVFTRARVHSNAKRHALKPRLELPLAAASAHVVWWLASRCGRDNPGSTPGVDNVAWSNCTLAPLRIPWCGRR